MEVTRQFLQTLVNYKFVTSKDETRLNLTGIHISGSNGRLRIAATNGYVLLFSYHDIIYSNTFDCDFDKIDFIIDAQKLNHIDDLLKEDKYRILFFVKFDESFHVSCTTTFVPENSETLRFIRRDFCRIEGLIPDDYEATKQTDNFNLDIELLVLIKKAVFGGRKTKVTPVINFKFYGANKPFVAVKVHKRVKHHCIIMPVKV